MGCEAGQCKTCTPKGMFIVIPSLEAGFPTGVEDMGEGRAIQSLMAGA